MTKYRCPMTKTDSDIEGCGTVFEAVPDDEGCVDCPNCGMWFTPAEEPDTEVKE